VAVFQSQLIDFLTLDYFIPHCCDLAAARDAGPAARENSRYAPLWSCLLLAEKVHAMGRSSGVKVDFDKSHIHKALRRHAAQIPTNSAKILNLSRAAYIFFANSQLVL